MSETAGAAPSRAVREIEEPFRLLVESVEDYAIFMLDPEGFVSTWNVGAERIKGYTAREIIGQHFSCFYPPERIKGSADRVLELAREHGRFEEENWRVRKDGTRFWANVVVTALRDVEGNLRGFAKITRDLTQRKRLEEVEGAARRVNEFLAVLAHELRNPLTPMRNVVALMRQRDLDEQLEWCADVMERQVDHVARLVNDLLDVGRLTSGKIQLKRVSVDASHVVAQAIEPFRPTIEKRNIRLESKFAPLPMIADAVRLSQVMVNLLDNAIKYTMPGGTITVVTERQEREALLRVRDTGIGIPTEVLPNVFDLFSQGGQGFDRTRGGLGIGLSLVRQLVEMHGGVVSVSSEGVGKGAEFVVRLPLTPAPEPPPGAEGPVPTPPTSGPARRRALVVDDDPDTTSSIRALLDAWGFDSAVANDGLSALQQARELRPDVVLLDIALPDMNGHELAEKLRELTGAGGPILIAISGFGPDACTGGESTHVGVDHHLVKPVDPDRLHELLTTLGTGSVAAEGRGEVERG